MGVISTLLDVIGALGVVIGAIILMNEAYATLISRPAPDRIVDWLEETEGEIVRYRAQLAYTTPDGVARTAASASRQFDSDREAQPAGTAVTVRNNKADPDWVKIEGDFFSRWGVALFGAPLGIAALALGMSLR